MKILQQQTRTTTVTSEGAIGDGYSEINSDLVRGTVGFLQTWSLVFIPTHGANKPLHLVDTVHPSDLNRL
jgi:hypothetical protein